MRRRKHKFYLDVYAESISKRNFHYDNLFLNETYLIASVCLVGFYFTRANLLFFPISC